MPVRAVGAGVTFRDARTGRRTAPPNPVCQRRTEASGELRRKTRHHDRFAIAERTLRQRPTRSAAGARARQTCGRCADLAPYAANALQIAGHSEPMTERPLLSRLFDASHAQEGCVSASQLAEIGITGDTIRSLIKRGALHRAAHGVYVVGQPTLSNMQLLWTGVLTAGSGAVVSHWSAAALHKLLGWPVGEAWITTPGRRGDRTVRSLLPMETTGRPGTIHIISARSGRVPALRRGLPLDSVARTLVAIAGAADGAVVAKAWREADYRNRLREEAIVAELGRGIAGSALIRELMMPSRSPVMTAPTFRRRRSSCCSPRSCAWASRGR